MADITKTIQIIFGAVDNTAGALTAVGRGIGDFSAAASGAIAPLNSMADAVKLVDTAIVAVGIAFGGASIVKAGEFGQQVAEIGTLFSATSGQLSTLSSGVLEYAAGSTQSIDQINTAIYNAISAGVDWTKSIDFLTQAEKLSIAGRADLASVTDVLIGTMNAYGAKTDEAGKFSDLFFKTVQLGQTTLPALAGSLSQVTSTAAAAKIPFEEVTAAVVGLTTSGIPTEQAMTALKGAIANIISPSQEAADEAARLGISFGANALEARGLSGVFGDVFRATNGNIESMAKLFGSMDALKAATALGADASGLYRRALEEMPRAAGAVETAYNAMANEFDNANQRMRNSIDVLMIVVGQRLGREFGNVVAELGNIFRSLTISVNAGVFDDVFRVFQEQGARLVAFLRGVAAALPEALELVDFSKFITSIRNLTGVLDGLFDGLDLATPEGLARVIQTITDTIANLLNAGAGIAQVWVDAAQAAAPLIQAFSEMDASTAKAAGSALGFADVLTLVLSGVGSVGQGLESLGTGLELLAGVQAGKLLVSLAASERAMAALGLAARATGVVIGVAGQAGLVGAAGAAGYAIGTVLNDGVNAVVRSLTGSESLGGLIYDLVNGTDELAENAPAAATGLRSMGEGASASQTALAGTGQALEVVSKEAKDSTKIIDEGLISSMINLAVKAGDAAVKADFLAASAKAIKNPTIEARLAMSDAAAAFKDSASKAGDAAGAAAIIRAEYEKMRTTVPGAARELKTSADVMDVLGKKTDLTNKELIELAKNTKAAEIELAKIASNERLKQMEFRVKLDVAQLEAGTKRIEATFESINTTINSTGDTLKGLFGLLANDDLGWRAIRTIERQIDLENKARQEAFKLQKKLTEAQIEEIKARTAAMIEGDGIIKIDGAGLQPHLEAFMWEILRTLQVRTNSQGLAMLLGT